MVELDGNALAKKFYAIFFQLESSVDKATFNSSSLNRIIDFVTAQYAIQYFCPFISKRLDPD